MIEGSLVVDRRSRRSSPQISSISPRNENTGLSEKALVMQSGTAKDKPLIVVVKK